MLFFPRKKKKYTEIDPDEVMIDSSNIPRFNTDQFEGRLEQPISKATIYSIGAVAALVLIIFLGRAWSMQIANGESYDNRSRNNLLRPVPLFAGRGVVYDRNGALLAWNAPASSSQELPIAEDLVAQRQYATSTGFSHVLGYVKYPSKDNNGFYYQEDFEGVTGVEKYFNDQLQGINGSRLVEVDARGQVISQNIVRPPEQGKNINLSIDARVQTSLYNNIKDIAERVGFAGGAGVIMDVHTGEVLAITSYPEYSSQVMSDKTDTVAVKSALNDPRLFFLDRAVDGLYTPGSIVKPFMAMGVLTEGIIDPLTVVYTTGSISIPNPYDPTKTTLFRDWKNLGPVTLRDAIAMSSDAYFYIVGGGYKDQRGLGIANIDKYLQLFGFGQKIPPSFFSSATGTIPTPEWKKSTFKEDWYLGDTYHTVIGQYGFQVTPVQVIRAVASIANKGSLLIPTIVKDDTPKVERTIDLPKRNFDIVAEGMRQSAMSGTSKALNVPFVHVAGKSGTAELGVSKDKVNSWITGFWPYENPKYAFAVMLEKGSVHNLIGAAAAMRQELDWMGINTPEYFK